MRKPLVAAMCTFLIAGIAAAPTGQAEDDLFPPVCTPETGLALINWWVIDFWDPVPDAGQAGTCDAGNNWTVCEAQGVQGRAAASYNDVINDWTTTGLFTAIPFGGHEGIGSYIPAPSCGSEAVFIGGAVAYGTELLIDMQAWIIGPLDP